MENAWATVRLATRQLVEATLQIADLLSSLPQFRDSLQDDFTFSDVVWRFIEDLLVCRLLVVKRENTTRPLPRTIMAELQRILAQNTQNDIPWVFSDVIQQDVIQPDIIQQCIGALEKINLNPDHVWLLGSLYEYRTGLLLQPIARGGSTKTKVTKNPHKKRKAIYYTPRDVVDFILQHTLHPLLAEIDAKVKDGFKEKALSDFCQLSILDPSCGGGAFLLPVLQQLIAFFDNHFQPQQILPCLHPMLVGIDIDPLAVRVARFSLWLITPLGHPLANAHTIMEGNALWPGASEIIPKFSFADQFPAIFSSGVNRGFTCVIGNPPYAEIPPSWPVTELSRRFQSSSSKDLYTLFLEQMVYLCNPKAGRGGMIVPLSLTFSKDLRTTRDFIRTSGHHWLISSYHIRPSGIFPGVSQRTSIALVKPSIDNRTRVESTYVQRWTAEKRADLFTRLQYADVTNCIELLARQGRPLGFPNIGNPLLSNLLLKLLQRGEKLADALIRVPQSQEPSWVLYYFSMAYHWLSVSAQLPDLGTINRSVALSSLIPLYFASEADRWVALAFLASSLGFWWWQIFGDLFHVTRAVLSQLPVNPMRVDSKTKEEIISLAKDLQADINKNVTFFTKKGVTNANFDLTQCFGKIRPIDEILRNYLHVPQEEWNALYTNYTDTTGKNIK